MRICYTSDLHGRSELYRQLDRLVSAEKPDLLILGGDLFRDGELDDPVASQVAYIEQTFVPRVRAWRGAVPGLEVACIVGNHDWLCAETALQVHHAAGHLVLLNHQRPWQRSGVRFLGYSKTPPTPYWVKDFERLDRAGDPIPDTGGAVWDAESRAARKALPEEHFDNHASLAEDLAAAPELDDPWIFVCHAPPFDTKLDRLPHIEYPIGSHAVRAFIEQRQPLCALHGHVHESPAVTGGYVEQIGRTLCINPGQTHERLHAVLFDTEHPAETLRHTELA
ncbi:MAG: metallophosphoesterase [Planctomycetes bacterium]|nr:metallophosphoesterase [Planctomycetota bacterium]